MAFNANEAIGVIKAGIESGSIKLRGSVGCGNIEAAKEIALIDAAYPKELYSDLIKDV
ncbi:MULTISPECIES: hypothetical protein [Polynucleobacter]|uniref:hypothetical protein n=1 Tax=Polynucleobacter TaxID=44013 RepID=UPI000AFC47BA|nr:MULTISPECIES: hypothetical protein [Polynucleobacter]MBU3552328.1 hypothetical protein [Polynucleobacter sp. MWH-Post4-6-1]